MKCSNCREPVPNEADQCPECGVDVEQNRKVGVSGRKTKVSGQIVAGPEQPRRGSRLEETGQAEDGTWWWKVWVDGQLAAGPFLGYREEGIAAAAAKCWYPLNGREE